MSNELEISKVTPSYWRATLNNPPINLFNPGMRNALHGFIDDLESDPQVKVVVFDTANPDFFISHVDLTSRDGISDTPGPTGLPSWPDFTTRIGGAPFITVASIRGRTRGVGSELIQALDVRFASLEKAIFGQPEIGFGFIPGGGGMERLWRLTGKARALEIIVSGADFDAATAELYGWVNRAIPDGDLDVFVDQFARRVASFSSEALAVVKRVLNSYQPPATGEELMASYQRFLSLLSGDFAQKRVRTLMENGLQADGDLERNLGERIASV